MVDDNRGMVQRSNLEWILMGQALPKPFTQARKDAWVERLESAGSNKALGVLHTEDGNAACALGHLQDIDQDADQFGVESELYYKIVELNDKEGLTLPEIAVWVKENVQVVDEP